VANCGGLLISEAFEVNSKKELDLKEGGITEDKLSEAVQLKLDSTSSGIADDVTIDITDDVISVKDGGISEAKLDTNVSTKLNSIASDTVLGKVKIDGTSITIDNDVISATSEIDDDLLTSLVKTYSIDKLRDLFQPRIYDILLYGEKSTGYIVNLIDDKPTVDTDNYIETNGTTNIVFDWVNGINIEINRTSSAEIKLRNTDYAMFNALVAFNRSCSVEYGSISYADGVAISSEHTYGNQDFAGVNGFDVVQALKYNSYFDLLPDGINTFPAGTIFTTKLFKRQKSITPSLTTRYILGKSVNEIDRFTFSKIEVEV